MTAPPMIESAARAIYESRNGAGAVAWGRLSKAHRAPYLSDARAVLAAIRIPTPGMIAAALDGTGRPLPPEADDWAVAAVAMMRPKAEISDRVMQGPRDVIRDVIWDWMTIMDFMLGEDRNG